MAKKKKELTEEKVSRLTLITNALVTLYGPLHMDDLADKIEEYFPEDHASVEEEDLFNIFFVGGESGVYYIDDDHDYISLFSEEEIMAMRGMPELRALMDLDVEKEFDDPQEILKYGNIFDLRGEEKYDALRAYFEKLEYKKKNTAEDTYREALVVIYKMYDEEEFFAQLRKRVKGSFDTAYLSELMFDVGGDMPRGIFHGYSFREISEIVNDPERMIDLEEGRIEIPKNYRKYGHYSYERCLKLADKLKDGGIFEDFCSDNLLEILVNGKEVFVQLLGYYNGDRAIVIYKDRGNMEYNYQFIAAEEGSYPDIAYRVNSGEIIFDEAGGFMTPEVRKQLIGKDLPQSPLMIKLGPASGPRLPSKEELDLYGAVLDNLVRIYDMIGEDIGKFCIEHNMFQIVQIYLSENDLEMGEYTYLELGDPVVPFEVGPIDRDMKISAKRDADICIGLYAIPILSEETSSYVTYVYNASVDLIEGFDVCPAQEMKDEKNKIIGILEANGLRPRSLCFNNGFCEEVYAELCDFYDLDDYEIGCEQVDAIYWDILTREDISLPEELIH
ncbi:MAG: hypothetical protein II153_07895 [Erysipelotrichaceae bacterium]|nr:hypothetical protein [Erysipelotrichaceae bacterium]